MKKQWIGFMIAGMLVAAVPTNLILEYGEKIKLALYYKGKKIGKDSCDYNDEVWYSNRVTEGMTQKQVRYTWGAPSSTSSSSYRFTYWNWDDGSMVSFRNGVVDYWFDAAN